MNFIKKNVKHILMGVTLSFFVLILGLGLGLSAFGMGMESQRFITSVNKTIDKYIPKGKVVLNGKGENFDTTYFILQNAYETDVQSTLTVEEQNDKAIMNFWKDYADTKFNERWKSIIDNKEDIDINEFSHALVQFDIEVAKQFHSYAFTHSGLAWIGQKKHYHNYEIQTLLILSFIKKHNKMKQFLINQNIKQEHMLSTIKFHLLINNYKQLLLY